MNAERGWQWTAATAVLAGTISFLWCFKGLLEKVQTSEIVWNPPTQGELVECICWGLLAVGAALKLDLPLFAKGLQTDMSSLAKTLTGDKKE